MILSEGKLEGHLGKKLEEINGKISRATHSKFSEFEAELRRKGLQSSIPSYIVIAHQFGSKPLNSIAREIGITCQTLKKVIDFYEIPTLTQTKAVREKWKDEDFRKRNAEAVRAARTSTSARTVDYRPDIERRSKLNQNTNLLRKRNSRERKIQNIDSNKND